MEPITYKVYPYRWIVLASFMFVVIANQFLWITFAPITGMAASFYQVSDLSIGLLSMIFMIVYIFISFPASWVIDTYGIRTGIGIGAVLTGVFGMMRGLFATDYTLVLIAQTGIAIGQPFILNSITKLAARWFPIHERATASGLGTLAMFLGVIIGITLTPFLVHWWNIEVMLDLYGIVSIIAVVAFFFLVKEKPPSPPCNADQEERLMVLAGIKNPFKKRDFITINS